MQTLQQLVCSHEFEPQAVWTQKEILVKECQKCGKRIEEDHVVDDD